MIELRPYQLRIISTVFSNVGSAFLFAVLTANNLYILLSSFAYAILLLGIALMIERVLDEL